MTTEKKPVDLLVQVQNGTGIAFSTFLTLHLANHLSTHFGFLFADGVRDLFRVYYQHPFVEVTVVVGSAFVHVLVGVIRYNQRKKILKSAPETKTKARPPLDLTLHRYAGYYLTLAYPGHVIATRVFPYLYKFEIGYYGPWLTLVYYPHFYYIYYGLLAAGGVYHMVYGLSKAIPYFERRIMDAWNSSNSNSNSNINNNKTASVETRRVPEIEDEEDSEDQAVMKKSSSQPWLSWKQKTRILMGLSGAFATTVLLAVGGWYFEIGDSKAVLAEFENALGFTLVTKK